MKYLENYFGCGKYSTSSRGRYGDFQVRKFSDIIKIIIPFFQKNTLEGGKLKDFNNWCKVAYLIKDKQHLTQEGLEQIREIRNYMNQY